MIRVGLGEVYDAVDQLLAVALAVACDGLDLGLGGGGVHAEDGLAVLPADGVATRGETAR